ncbi:RNA-directed DNA polymerase, eukaryota, partial [Tanacetum coccineum]
TALLNEGFVDLSVRYLGELWVLLKFSSSKTKEAFCGNVGVSSWFSEIRQASLDIIPDGHIVWVEVEGVPLKLWTMNTFRRIATKWGDLIDVDDIDESYFHLKRLCLYTKSSLNIYKNFKIIFQGNVFWIRAKEIPGWVPDLIEESKEEEQSDVGSLEGDNKTNEDDLYGDNMNMGTELYQKMGRSGGDGVSVNVNSKGDDVDSVSADVFNSFIVNAGLEEVPIGGSAFTGCHKSATKMSKLDRLLVSNNLLNIFPHINAITLERYLSDHMPILLRETIHDYVPVPFRFFHHWLELDGFYTFVSDTWRNAPADMSNGMRNMTGKLKFLKSKIRKWIKDNRCNRKVAFDKLKEELRLVDEAIDKGVGTEEVVNKRVEVLNSLRYIDQMHAMDLAQKAKIKWSIEGDENSSFFHGMLNKKRNQSNIRGIMVDGVWKDQPNDVKREFLNHFQERFDKPVERRVTIDMSYPRSISGEQRDELEREVTIEEIKTAVWNCGTDKSPGPDGFTFDFYRQFWSTIDKDVYAAVNHFFINGDIPAGCNSSFIALIPKVPDANLVKDFRPISLIGSIYKIIAKILTNRLINVLGDIVSEKKQKSLIFKVDFEKAYDSVRWDFLDDVLKKFGFGNKWCNWIQFCLKSSRGSIPVNGSPTDEFQFYKGLKQGDPLSPFLFILIMESLHLSFQWVVDVGLGWNYVAGSSITGGRRESEDSALQVENENFIHWRLTYIAEIYVSHEIGSKKESWVKWNNVLMDKKCGGLRVSSLYALNKGLMIKWLWKFFVHKDSLWTKVITAIHGVNGNVSSSGAKAGRSCWLAIVDEVRALHKKGVYVFDFMNLKLGNGEMVKFWLDRWYEGGILKDLFPRMFALENMKEITVSSKLNGDNLADSFRRSPRGN